MKNKYFKVQVKLQGLQQSTRTYFNKYRKNRMKIILLIIEYMQKKTMTIKQMKPKLKITSCISSKYNKIRKRNKIFGANFLVLKNQIKNCENNNFK